MHFVLQHHHEEAPAREGLARRVDHLDAPAEPLPRRVLEEGHEALPRGPEPGEPARLVVGIRLGLLPDPSLATIGAGEVEARPAYVPDDLADTPSYLTADGGRAPGCRSGRQGRHVAFRPPPQAVEEAQIRVDVGDHAA